MDVKNQIIADVPTSRPGLGFQDYAAAIAEAVAAGQPPQFTVGLYGRWGSGKSSLLKSVRRILDEQPDIITVEFDAWRYQRSQELVIPLLHAVFQAARAREDQHLAKSLGRLVRAFGLSLSIEIPGWGVGTSIEKIRDMWSETNDVPVELDDAFARPYDELRNVGQALGSRRIVVLVDDLDRCTSENVVSMLESINVITDVPGFVFVLALDYDVLVSAVELRYPHVSGHEFIEKIVQVPFRIPRIEAASAEALEAIIPNLDHFTHLAPLRNRLLGIAEVVFNGNPRSLKRFVNALTILMRVMTGRGLEFNAELLSLVLATELRWPQEFQDVRTAVAAADPDPLSVLRNSEDESLSQFVQTFPPAGPDTLSPLLRLTETITDAADIEDLDRDAAHYSLLERGRERIRDTLGKLGFRLDPRSERAYYLPDYERKFRIIMSKQVVRIEVPNLDDRGRNWRLKESYRYTIETDSAIEAIRQLP